jgi:hypothetical protein
VSCDLEACSLNLDSCLLSISFVLKMGAFSNSEMSVDFCQTTRHQISDDSTLQAHKGPACVDGLDNMRGALTIRQIVSVISRIRTGLTIAGPAHVYWCVTHESATLRNKGRSCAFSEISVPLLSRNKKLSR